MVINPRAAVTALKITRALLLLAIPLSIGALWVTHPQEPDLTTIQANTDTPKTLVESTAHDLEWYAPLWERDLKQPPIPNAVKKPSARTSKQDASLPKLIATLVEPQARYAHLKGANGRVKLVSVGDTFGRFTVSAIVPGRVQLQDGEALVWIEMPKTRGMP